MKQIYCPVCGRPTTFDSPPVGLFCTERCKLIDLSKWLGEEYRVTEPLRPDHLAEYEEMEGDQLDSRTDR